MHPPSKEELKSKIELLMTLANVDGQLHPSELAFVMGLMTEHKVNPSEFQHLGKQHNNSVTDKINNKFEFLFLALKLIQADNHIALTELSFCRDIALKLGFKPAVVDHFAEKKLDNPIEFKRKLREWLI